MFKQLMNAIRYSAETLATPLLPLVRYLSTTPKLDPAVDMFFARHQIAVEHATWKIAHHEDLYYAHAGIMMRFRGSIDWSVSRDRRILCFLRRYKGRYLPSIEKLRQAEQLTQELGITIEAADTLVQLRDRKHSLSARQELIADDRADKLKDRDYYLVA